MALVPKLGRALVVGRLVSVSSKESAPTLAVCPHVGTLLSSVATRSKCVHRARMASSSTKSPPEWTIEKVIEFIELYQAHPIIWDATRKDHKNKNLLADAWRTIQQNMGMNFSIEDLKKKRESLMSTYRLYRKKISDSTRSGSSTDDIFKPNWFAYELMDRFLAPIYDKSDTVTINTETMEFPNEDSNQDRSFSNEGSIQNRSSTSAKKRRESEVTEVRAQIKTAVNVLKNLSDRPRTEVDEVDLYCQLLAKKIKKFNEQQREVIMHDIDELIYQKRNDSYLNINSPARSSTYSYVRSTPDSVRFTPTPPPSSQMLAYDMSTRDSVRYAHITSPSPQVMPSPSYHVADDYSDYTVVSPNHSQVEYVTGSSTSTTSTPKVTIISNDIISQAFTLSQIQNKN